VRDGRRQAGVAGRSIVLDPACTEQRAPETIGAAEQRDAPVGALRLKMLHAGPHFINVCPAGIPTDSQNAKNLVK